MPNLPKVPLESWISEGVNWLTTHLSGLTAGSQVQWSQHPTSQWGGQVGLI